MNRKEMIRRQQELLEAARAAGRELTANEQAEFDSLQRQIDALPETPQVNEEEIRSAERARVSEINNLCRSFDVADSDVARYISEGYTVDSVRAAILEQVQNSRGPVARGAVDVLEAEEDKFREAASDALVMRSGIAVENPAAGANEFMGASLRDLAVRCLASENGNDVYMKSADDVYQMAVRQFYSPTAAFPAILDQAIRKAYVEGHRKANVTFERFTSEGTLSDFKTNEGSYLAGPAGEFLEVPEGGELKHDIPADQKLPSRKLKTYGRQFTMTRQAFINDDIGLITTVPARYAASARKTINKQVYQILVNNPAIYDGTALFSSAHGNLVSSGTGITQASMQSMIMALQTQLDQFGEAIIIRPATIVVPAGMAFDLYTLFNSPTINTAGNTQAVNPLYRYANSIEIVEDPTINVLSGGFGNAMPWFLIGDKNDTAFIQVDYLNGRKIPAIRKMETPGQLGFVWDIYLDWGISVQDYRGAIKNPGITVSAPL